MKIFWSWQSDLLPRNDQHLVRDALRDACDALAGADGVEAAQRPEVDHDTTGVPGTPDIVGTILAKIEKAAVFVADVTPVAVTIPADLRPGVAQEGLPPAKRLQNPNVMSELGYAEHAIGKDRIVLVANAARYTGPGDLPFDWRHRRGPITYHLPDDAGSAERQRARRELAGRLLQAMRPILAAAAMETPEPPSLLLHRPSGTDPALWEGSEDGVTFNESLLHDERRTARLRPGPRLFVRLAAADWPGLPRSELDRRMTRQEVRLWMRGNAGSSGMNGAGALGVGGLRTAEDGAYEANALTQWFADNGEIWAVDVSPFGTDADGLRSFAYQMPLPHLARFLSRATAALRDVAPRSRVEIELGATNLSSTAFLQPSGASRIPALADRVAVRETSADWTVVRRNELLLRFWNGMLDVYGLPPAADVDEMEALGGAGLDRA